MENIEQTKAFYLLDEKIQRWIWQQGWTELREAQEEAIQPILEGKTDVIIAAATASGKTEAAFLPICSRLLKTDNFEASILYISPLKALINDQFSRISDLCKELDIKVYPWHGDIGSGRKKGFVKEPAGILLITPESLEAIFVNYGHDVKRIFSRLLYVIVDELHSFIGSERGIQLQSLLHRVEIAIRRRVPRIGLSATIGDMLLAAEFLRPGQGKDVRMIVSRSSGQELKLLLKGYVEKEIKIDENSNELKEDTFDDSSVESSIAESLFKTLRGTSNLIFANRRASVETYSDNLRGMCEENRVPNEFWPHHGSLSKELREEAESAIKDKSRPVSIVCTSTLEMGIDIGSVTSIAQIGVSPSVASMRQRLGRSGRRGDPAILRIYITEQEITNSTPLQDTLRANLVQSIAMVRLLLLKWYEPPPAKSFHLSTLIQQILSLIAQYGGVTASQAWDLLCNNGPFDLLNKKQFIELLRCMGNEGLLAQTNDGLLLHGRLGEKIVNHYSFYTAFITPEEYRLITRGKTLGTLPIDRPLSEGSLLIFGGRRWEVTGIDQQKKIIELIPAKGGRPPSFGGQAGWVHDSIRQEMYKIYTENDIPVFLDPTAKELLGEARYYFNRYGLENKHILQNGKNLLFFCWRGDKVMDTITALLRNNGIKAENDGIAITVLDTTEEELTGYLKNVAKESIEALELARTIKNKPSAKYDNFLSEDLMCADYLSSKMDLEGAQYMLKQIIGAH